MKTKTDIWLTNHRRKEALCAKTLKGRALLTIDHILSNIESEDKLLSKLYRIAHCATGICDHAGWVEELETTYLEVRNETT